MQVQLSQEEIDARLTQLVAKYGLFPEGLVETTARSSNAITNAVMMAFLRETKPFLGNTIVGTKKDLVQRIRTILRW